jgi:hypothetical protein
MAPILVQIIGFVGLSFFVLSFQQKNRNRILVLMLFGQAIFLLHFVLLAAWTAAGMNVIGMVRTLIFRFRDEQRWADWKFWPFVFVLLFILAGLMANESWIGILPVGAMSVETIGLWKRNLKTLRFINLFPHPFWFIYNLVKGSWAGVVCEIFVLSSIIIAIFRYDRREKRIAASLRHDSEIDH